jgi:hypothetical protein
MNPLQVWRTHKIHSRLPWLATLRLTLNVLALAALASTFGLVIGCSGGAGSTLQTAPPSNLVYPQTTISATVGQAISSDVPTVTGVVASYTISPTLPAGLSMSTSTGAISGTPTAVAARATYTITATSTSGSTTTTIAIIVAAAVVAPTNFVYPVENISGKVGQAIATDTPTITGTVSIYAIGPALPAGLSLDNSTGAISGTPTAQSPQTTYEVTATNSAGSAQAVVTVEIDPIVPAPTNLVYPQLAIVAIVGQAITADIPSVTGTVASWSVSPALPAGFNLDPSSGAITGTPTTVAAQATYTISAINAGGSTTANITIAVNQPSTSLLDLGHAAQIITILVGPNRVLSQDSSAHWVLWDYTADKEIASGDPKLLNAPPFNTPSVWPVKMAGSIFAIGLSNGLEIRSVTDGHLLTTIASPMIDPPDATKAWWQLASDGSYVCAGSQTGLTAWSPSGIPILSKTGDYSTAKAFAASGQVLVGNGAAGPNVIETISTVTAIAFVGPAFDGQFNTWFLDGENFLTNTGNTVWTYSKSGVQQEAITALPAIDNLGGQGHWFWTYNSQLGNPLAIYAIGSSAPVATYNIAADTTVVPSGTAIGLLAPGPASASVIDLAGTTPTKLDYTLPVAYDSGFGAFSGSQWLVGNSRGVLVDQPGLFGVPRILALGEAWSIAGGMNRAAVATASGTIFYFDPASSTAQGTIPFSSSKIALTSDGNTLAAAANANDSQYETDRTLNIFSLPSATLIQSTPYSFQQGSTALFDFTLSGSGATIGQVLETLSSSGIAYSDQVTPISGTPIIWSQIPNDPTDEPILISPDGTLIAVSNGQPSAASATNVFKNGVLVTAAPGWAVGWIDNNRILTNNYAATRGGGYINATIYDATGTKLATVAVPELKSLQPVDSDSIYSPELNSIFSLTTGAALWTSPNPSTGVGAVAGSYVVFASGSQVLAESH